jgi:hypothetical protein
MRWCTLASMCGALLGAFQSAVAQTGGAAAPLAARVQAGVRVSADTVRVGDPFTVTVRVRMPAAARIEWPELRDSTAVIAPRAPMVRRDPASDSAAATRDAEAREELVTFVVAAWDTGTVATTWPPALVILDADTVPVRLADARVYVQSVLPADTAAHQPRPYKPPFAAPMPWWQRWWPLWVAIAALLAWWGWRRWRRRPTRRVTTIVAALGPYERATQAFDRLERLALADAGEHGRTVTLSVEILRTYLAARVPATSLAQTSAEVLAEVQHDPRVPADALLALFVAADTVKYAGRALDPDVARRLVASARAIVDDVESRDAAQRTAQRAAESSGTDDGSSSPDASGHARVTDEARQRATMVGRVP